MAPIIDLLILLLIVTGAIVWAYIQFPISDRLARKIEIAGYVFLFVLVIWEFVVKNIMLGDFYNDDWIYLNDKLFAIYTLLSDIIAENNHDALRFWEVFTQDTPESSKLQLLYVDAIEAFLQISSVVMIAIGRFQDLRNREVDKEGDCKQIPKKKHYITIECVDTKETRVYELIEIVEKQETN